ncbi:MAG: helix-turn-helix domain-containing protein [Deltaproteobacteria bacterium]|nr:helix-turn-helix domain-containing protein [Deltaproteobacteria bacterium]MBW2393849.1 helix-turn-helix domain-containing protein [Deltaproteobacteria bacterium]
MKPLSEMTHYDVLEIQAGSPADEVERAYRIAQTTWAADGLATYSLYEEGESESIRERIELAYQVLSGPDTKAEYDRRLEPGETEMDFEEVDLDLQFVDETVAGPSVDLVPAEIEAFDDAADEGGDTEWTGARLRRARLRRGIDLEKIAEVTKINPTYLQYIEQDQFEDLPAAVYVRGFVVSLARCIGLESGQVADGYMARLREHTPEKRRPPGRHARR